MFISNAYAQAAAPAGAAGGLMSFLPIILMFVVLYFLMIRPQMKRQKEQKAMIDGLAKGDEIVTAGGVVGKITKVSPQPLTGQHTLALTRAVMNDKQGAEFERTKECNFAISPQGVGRFRVNAFVQQGQVGLVFRTIPAKLPTIA